MFEFGLNFAWVDFRVRNIGKFLGDTQSLYHIFFTSVVFIILFAETLDRNLNLNFCTV